jgi:hypothetical protein
VVGGGFELANGLSVNNIARWDGTQWFPLGLGTSPGNVHAVTALKVIGDDLFVGGSFTGIGDTKTAYFAKWHADTTLAITHHPEDATSCRTGTAQFTATLSEHADTFEWRKGGVPVDLNDPRITVDVSPDGRSSTLTIEGTLAVDEGTGTGGYTCTAANSCGQVTTDPADLVVCVADFDCSGFTDLDDYSAFVASFEAGTDDADVDASGFIDLDDFTYFVERFEAGC